MDDGRILEPMFKFCIIRFGMIMKSLILFQTTFPIIAATTVTCNQILTQLLPAQQCVTVFFELFFEVEPFAAILIANRTHGRSQKFV